LRTARFPVDLGTVVDRGTVVVDVPPLVEAGALLLCPRVAREGGATGGNVVMAWPVWGGTLELGPVVADWATPTAEMCLGGALEPPAKL
jgi:hypothetical protein